MSLVPGSCFLHYHCMPCPSSHLGERRVKKLPISFLLVIQRPYRSGLGSWHHSPTDAITSGSHNWSLLQRCFTGSRRDSTQMKPYSTWMRLCLRKECRIWCITIPIFCISLIGYWQLLQSFNLAHWLENTLGEETLQLLQSAAKGRDSNWFQQSRS